jgi:hypothetical protein
MDVIAVGDRILMFPIIVDVRRNDQYYASVSCSAHITKPWGQIKVGACHRAEYYRFARVQPSNPPDAQALRRMRWGNYLAQCEIDLHKESGHFIRSEPKMWDEKHHLAGRVDEFMRNPDTFPNGVVGNEYKATWAGGTKGTIYVKAGEKPFPKWNHLIQTAVYHDFYRSAASCFNLIYMDRGAAKMRAHIVVVTEEGRISVNGEFVEFGMEHIWNELEELGRKLRNPDPPPRDYTLVYDKELTKEMAKAGAFSNTDTEKIKKGHKVLKGDWECKYCEYVSYCWQGEELPYGTTPDRILGR